MSNKKQTAVEFSKFNVKGEVLDLIGGYLTIKEFSINIQKWFNQAKELEKKQIIEFTSDFIDEYTYGDYDGDVQKSKTIEEYYNEKFKNK